QILTRTFLPFATAISPSRISCWWVTWLRQLSSRTRNFLSISTAMLSSMSVDHLAAILQRLAWFGRSREWPIRSGSSRVCARHGKHSPMGPFEPPADFDVSRHSDRTTHGPCRLLADERSQEGAGDAQRRRKALVT